MKLKIKIFYIFSVIVLTFSTGCVFDIEDEETNWVSGWHNEIRCTSFKIEGGSAWGETKETVNPFFAALPFNNRTYKIYHEKGYETAFPFSPATLRQEVKNQWIEIYYGGKTVFVQWQDVGPWFVEDYEYVFDTSAAIRPRAESFIGEKVDRFGTYSQQGFVEPGISKSICNGAGIDISPEAMEYLTGEKMNHVKVRWRFALAEEALLSDPLKLRWAKKINE
ncbi:MAG: hypothetical protein ACQESP_00255 [Candidatus Muiribacteriota bacterium]